MSTEITSESLGGPSLEALLTSEMRDGPDPEEPLFNTPVPGDSPMFSAFQILLNTAIGSGTLMVPYCYTLGVGTAFLISVVFGLVAYCSLHFMIDASFYAKQYDYRGLFAHSFGHNRLWIVNSMIMLVQFGAAMIYGHWNGRLLNRIVGSKHVLIGSNPFWTFVVSCFAVFPLTIFRSIAKLESIAMLSTLFIMVLIVHALYWFIKGIVEDGFDPQGQIAWFRMNTVAITALGVNSMAFNCHINLFPCLEHLKDCSVKRARSLAGLTIGVSFILYNIFGVFTYLYLFDGIGRGSALEFYSAKNWFTKITTIGVVVVLVASSPLVIWAARNSINNMFWKDEATHLRWVVIGGGLCVASGFLASTSDNVILFFDIVGGLFTPAIIFLMPALFYLKNCKFARLWQKGLALVICSFTVIASVACTYQAVSEIIEKVKE